MDLLFAAPVTSVGKNITALSALGSHSISKAYTPDYAVLMIAKLRRNWWGPSPQFCWWGYSGYVSSEAQQGMSPTQPLSLHSCQQRVGSNCPCLALWRRVTGCRKLEDTYKSARDTFSETTLCTFSCQKVCLEMDSLEYKQQVQE